MCFLALSKSYFAHCSLCLWHCMCNGNIWIRCDEMRCSCGDSVLGDCGRVTCIQVLLYCSSAVDNKTVAQWGTSSNSHSVNYSEQRGDLHPGQVGTEPCVSSCYSEQHVISNLGIAYFWKFLLNMFRPRVRASCYVEGPPYARYYCRAKVGCVKVQWMTLRQEVATCPTECKQACIWNPWEVFRQDESLLFLLLLVFSTSEIEKCSYPCPLAR